MKKFFILILGFSMTLNMMAQLEVKEGSFKEVEGFVNINPDNDYQFDDNDRPFAVLKINTENINDKQRRELKFEGNAATFIMLEYKTGEVWVYLTAKYADYLKISHPDFGSTEFDFPFDLKAKKGYEMVLINKSVDEDFQKRLKDIETLIATGQGSISNEGYLVINTTPEDGATVFIDGEAMKLKTPFVSDKLNAGKHRVRVTKDLYKPYVSVVDITKGETTDLNIELKPNYAELKVVTSDIAEIWIDGVKKGSGTWTGYVSLENHMVEAKKEGYRTQTKTIKLDLNDNKTLTFNSMEMITGDLEIVTTPRKANIKINNEHFRTTPQTLNGLKIGNYKVEINKRKYQPVVKNVTVKDGEKTSVNIQLERYKSLRTKGWVIRPDIEFGVIGEPEPLSYKIKKSYEYHWGTSITYNIKRDNTSDYFKLGASMGYQFNPFVYCGINLGVDINDLASILSMPISFNPRFYFNNRETSLYFDIKVGYAISLKATDSKQIAWADGPQGDYSNYIIVNPIESYGSGIVFAFELGLEYKHSDFGFAIGAKNIAWNMVIQDNYIDDSGAIQNNVSSYNGSDMCLTIMLKYGYNIFLKKK